MPGLIDANTGLVEGTGLYVEPGLGGGGLDDPPATDMITQTGDAMLTETGDFMVTE